MRTFCLSAAPGPVQLCSNERGHHRRTYWWFSRDVWRSISCIASAGVVKQAYLPPGCRSSVGWPSRSSYFPASSLHRSAKKHVWVCSFAALCSGSCDQSYHKMEGAENGQELPAWLSSVWFQAEWTLWMQTEFRHVSWSRSGHGGVIPGSQSSCSQWFSDGGREYKRLWS